MRKNCYRFSMDYTFLMENFSFAPEPYNFLPKIFRWSILFYKKSFFGLCGAKKKKKRKKDGFFMKVPNFELVILFKLLKIKDFEFGLIKPRFIGGEFKIHGLGGRKQFFCFELKESKPVTSATLLMKIFSIRRYLGILVSPDGIVDPQLPLCIFCSYSFFVI